jgi:hypothetical protein
MNIPCFNGFLVLFLLNKFRKPTVNTFLDAPTANSLPTSKHIASYTMPQRRKIKNYPSNWIWGDIHHLYQLLLIYAKSSFLLTPIRTPDYLPRVCVVREYTICVHAYIVFWTKTNPMISCE